MKNGGLRMRHKASSVTAEKRSSAFIVKEWLRVRIIKKEKKRKEAGHPVCDGVLWWWWLDLAENLSGHSVCVCSEMFCMLRLNTVGLAAASHAAC